MSERPEVSKKNDDWISAHRYYELKHFCMQYPEWKNNLSKISDSLSIAKQEDILEGRKTVTAHSSPVEKMVLKRSVWLHNINLIERAAYQDKELGSYILKAVTLGLSYDQMSALDVLPCGRELYYKKYRHFFFLLNQLRE